LKWQFAEVQEASHSEGAGLTIETEERSEIRGQKHGQTVGTTSPNQGQVANSNVGPAIKVE
jgi:hypothetical protein